MKKSIIYIFMLGIIFNCAIAQEKYAILIIGDEASIEEGTIRTLNNQGNENLIFTPYGEGEEKWYIPMEEFWFDAVILYNELIDEGYSDDNIFLLFGRGYDYEPSSFPIAPCYDPEPNITDYPARVEDVENIFEWLRDGNYSQGIPALTDDDFLFVWTFDHGGFEDLNGNSHWDEGEEVFIMLMDANFQNGVFDFIMASNFSAQLNQITCNRRSIWMQQCHSGGFIEYLENNKSTVLTACHASEGSHPADNKDIYGNPKEEWETIIHNNVEHTYRHGEFNLHTMASVTGEYPTGDPAFADMNNDNEISALETKVFNEENNSHYLFFNWETPQWSDINNIGEYTSIKYPTLLHTDINQNETHRGIIGISKDVHITFGSQLTFYNNADVYLLNESQIIVDLGATLVIDDGVSLFGNENTQITVDGNIQIGQNVTFTDVGNVILNNLNLQTTFNNSTFIRSCLINKGIELNITNSFFNDCFILYSCQGDVTVTGTDFDCTWLHLDNLWTGWSFTADITNCNFIGETNCYSGIFIWNYGRFIIDGNSIQESDIGIQIWESGYGITGNQNISNNTIYINSISGISIYNSIASIAGNHIHNNNYGVRLFNNSNIALYGNPGATTYAEAQQITDNDSYEVYASQYSFPWYFRNNVIIDEDNLGNPLDPLVYHDLSRDIYRDVRYNCWGNNFVAEEDLYPVNGYGYLPIWCPSGGKDTPVPGSDEAIYTNAKDLFEAEFYAQSKDSFQLLINQYPESHYSQAAMKDMFALEQFESNDYENLMDYFRTNDSIVADSSLAKLGDFLANKCDVKLENWQTAIYWYEDVIQNPESTEDSIFAIIDLGYTYFLMNNSGNKAGYTGKMLEHIPKSMKEFRKKRDYLLSLLPVDKKNNELENSLETLKAGELSQNIPNPFSNTTTIYYKLFELGSVHIKVFNHLGIEVKAINKAVKEKGLHKVELNANDLPPGIYYYSLLINGKLSDTKKMIVIK